MKINRRYYEAKVLVVPLEPAAETSFEQMLETGLEGVLRLDEGRPWGGQPGSYQLAPAGPGESPAMTGTLAETLDTVDIVILLASDLPSTPKDRVRELASAAREAGDLIAAVMVGREGAESPQARDSLAVLRSEVDMVVGVRKASLAAAFIDVIRGGAPDRADEPTDPGTRRRAG